VSTYTISESHTDFKLPKWLFIKSTPSILPSEICLKHFDNTELLLQGYTNKQIAGMLHISENTMKTHTRNIYSKLNVANKRELLQLAFSSSSPQGI